MPIVGFARLLAAVGLVVGLASFSGGAANAGDAATNAVFHGVGMVKGVDRAKGWLTIDHEAIPNFMAAMEMTYRVEPPRLVDTIQVGDRVAFDIDGGRETIVGVSIVAPAKR